MSDKLSRASFAPAYKESAAVAAPGQSRGATPRDEAEIRFVVDDRRVKRRDEAIGQPVQPLDDRNKVIRIMPPLGLNQLFGPL